MSIPEFFIVGAPKCGTTTLYDWLGLHPEVHAPHKETCFFSQDIFPTQKLRTHIPSLTAYEVIFETSDPAVKISGEATPKYLYSDLALQEVSRLRPDARIIVCLRDPVDLVISFHNQKIKEGEETEPDFAKAWARSMSADGSRITSLEPTINGKINYAFWGAYGQRLQTLRTYFPQENIRIYTLRELNDHPAEIYQDLCRFLDISPDHPITFKPSNQGRQMRSAKLHLTVIRFKRFLAPVLQPLIALRGGKGFGVLKLLRRFNSTPGNYDQNISAQLRAQISALLEEDHKLAISIMGGKRL